jgi:hypothetical protein
VNLSLYFDSFSFSFALILNNGFPPNTAFIADFLNNLQWLVITIASFHVSVISCFLVRPNLIPITLQLLPGISFLNIYQVTHK